MGLLDILMRAIGIKHGDKQEPAQSAADPTHHESTHDTDEITAQAGKDTNKEQNAESIEKTIDKPTIDIDMERSEKVRPIGPTSLYKEFFGNKPDMLDADPNLEEMLATECSLWESVCPYFFHPDPEVRLTVIAVLQRIHTMGSQYLLINALADPDTRVSGKAAEMIWADGYGLCEKAVKSLSDEMVGSGIDLGPIKAESGLSVLVSRAPCEDFKDRIEALIRRETGLTL